MLTGGTSSNPEQKRINSSVDTGGHDVTQITGHQSFHKPIRREGEGPDLVDLRKPVSSRLGAVTDQDHSVMLKHPDGGVGYGDGSPVRADDEDD